MSLYYIVVFADRYHAQQRRGNARSPAGSQGISKHNALRHETSGGDRSIIEDTDRRAQHHCAQWPAAEGVARPSIDTGRTKGSLMNMEESADTVTLSAPAAPSLEMDSVALQRLIEEVRTSEPVATGSYNRTYNRHNR